MVSEKLQKVWSIWENIDSSLCITRILKKGFSGVTPKLFSSPWLPRSQQTLHTWMLCSSAAETIDFRRTAVIGLSKSKKICCFQLEMIPRATTTCIFWHGPIIWSFLWSYWYSLRMCISSKDREATANWGSVSEEIFCLMIFKIEVWSPGLHLNFLIHNRSVLTAGRGKILFLRRYS